jgi:hypothetical protein
VSACGGCIEGGQMVYVYFLVALYFGKLSINSLRVTKNEIRLLFFD